jgi:ABC-type lipoprotein release transport system permease subunit
VAEATESELVFVVDVSSFTEKGFVGSTEYEGKSISIEFDDGDLGVFLTSEMAKRLHVRKGSPVLVLVEDDRPESTKTMTAGVGSQARISNPKVYYAVGREGGAVVRVKKD